MQCHGHAPETSFLYDDDLIFVISRAYDAFSRRIESVGRSITSAATAWVQSLWPAGTGVDYFTHSESFPVLLLPWLVAKEIADPPDRDFHQSLVYSTINGYYAIRLIDNLMDGHGEDETMLLPLLSVFHTDFQMPYHAYFPSDHPFWLTFRTKWDLSSESTLRDSQTEDITQAIFEEVAARKTCAAEIPVAAVCWQAERADLVQGWSLFIEAFGRWHQFQNDLFGWKRDLDNDTRSYFLCEADRRKSDSESAADWVLTKGFSWGTEKLKSLTDDLRSIAADLGSDMLLEYIAMRETVMARKIAKVSAGMKKISDILRLINSERTVQ